MKFWRIVGVFFIALTVGCIMSPLRQAESHIAKKEYEQALRIYLKILRPHIREGRRFVYYKPEIVTGIGIIYWHMKRYKAAVRVLNMVNTRTPTYGKAIFYQGACWEMLRRPEKALDIYRRFTAIPKEDRYREAIKGRLDWLVRQKIAREVKQTITDEQKLSVSSIPKNSIAILYFYNMTDNPQWNPLQKGLAEMMITDFTQVNQLQVVERLRLQKLIEEMNMTMTGLMDADRSSQLGKFLGARTLVKGSYMILPGKKIELSAGTVDILDTGLPELSKVNGSLTELFLLEKKIVLKSIADLGITLTHEQRDRIMKVPTKDFKAFLNYCYGLDALDLGNFDIAQHYFRQAIRLDPDFYLAQDRIVPPEVFEATQIKDVIQMNTKIAEVIEPFRDITKSIREGAPSFYRISTTSRLQEMGSHMDAGFIPSNDTREAYQEAQAEGAVRIELPGPPAPPFIPDKWFLPGPPDPPNRR